MSDNLSFFFLRSLSFWFFYVCMNIFCNLRIMSQNTTGCVFEYEYMYKCIVCVVGFRYGLFARRDPSFSFSFSLSLHLPLPLSAYCNFSFAVANWHNTIAFKSCCCHSSLTQKILVGFFYFYFIFFILIFNFLIF